MLQAVKCKKLVLLLILQYCFFLFCFFFTDCLKNNTFDDTALTLHLLVEKIISKFTEYENNC